MLFATLPSSTIWTNWLIATVLFNDADQVKLKHLIGKLDANLNSLWKDLRLVEGSYGLPAEIDPGGQTLASVPGKAPLPPGKPRGPMSVNS